MNNSAIPQARSLDVSHYPGEASRKSLSKIFPSIFPCNPLKRLDPDEEIQGNPTRVSGGFGSENARAKKNQMDRPDWCWQIIRIKLV
jgi:hypothetical protein